VVRKSSVVYRVVLTTLIIVGLFIPSKAADEIDLLTKYFDYLVSGNYESAAYLWDEKSLDRASRFGIEYTGIPLKTDCGSPIVRNLAVMKNYLQPPARLSIRLAPPEYMRLEYSHVVNSQEVRHDYYVRMDGGYYWLIYPQDYFCRDYKTLSSKYYRVHYATESKAYLHPAALAKADAFVVQMADSLRLSPEALSLLELQKIDYFFAASDSIVSSIVGHPVQGTFDLASDDIISATFPHFHEISHFLVNYALKSLPLYTLPILREGVAVHYGGRFWNASAPLDELGKFLMDQQVVEVDSILTMSGFQDLSGSDIAYPLAGVFCAYLLDRLGHEKFWQMYRDCSGDIDSLAGLTPVDVQGRIMRVTGDSSWSQVLASFKTFTNSIASKRRLLPGLLAGSKPVAKIGSAVVSESGEWISVEVSAKDSTGPVISLFFGKDKKLAVGKSSLFTTQFRDGVPFEGYHWALRLDRNEAGIYDYVGNQLTAKYIYAMDPDSMYYAKDENTVRVRFHRGLIGGTIPAAGDMKLLNK
jgi:hypothetical protein